jgi:hypothetical protein
VVILAVEPELVYLTPVGPLLYSKPVGTGQPSNMNIAGGHHIPLTLGQAEVDILHVTMTRYATAAGVVIIIYDYLLTIGDEVGRIRCTY